MTRRQLLFYLLTGVVSTGVVFVCRNREHISPTVLLGDGLDAQGHWLGWAGGHQGFVPESHGLARGRVAGRTEADMDVQVAGKDLPDVLRKGWQAVWNRVRGVNCDEACMNDLYKRWAYSKNRAGHDIQRERPPPPPSTQSYEITQSSLNKFYKQFGLAGQQLIPGILNSLVSYAPLAVSTEKSLAQSLASKHEDVPPMRHAPERNQLQYGLTLSDEYDAKAQNQEGRYFAADEVPKLKCPRRYMAIGDRWGDCSIKGNKEYNRMFFLDRQKADKPATKAQIAKHMKGVKHLVDGWRDLLVGSGSKSGKLAFDSPYYFCYDNYQEDPDFTECLRQLALYHGEFRVHRWAKDALEDEDEPEDDGEFEGQQVREGFPALHKEWVHELDPELEEEDLSREKAEEAEEEERAARLRARRGLR